MNKKTHRLFARIALALLMALPASGWAKTKVVLIAGRDSHGTSAHNWGDGVDLLSDALTKESGLDIETAIHKGGWPKDASIFDGAATVVILSDGGGGHPINRYLKEFDALAEKGVGLVCVHYAVEVPKGYPGKMLLKWIGGYFETFWSVNPHWTAEFKSIPKHPVANGVKPFALKDEWYYHMRFRDGMEGVTPILSALPPADTLKRGDGPHSNNPAVRKAVLERKEKQHLAWTAERPNGQRGFGTTGAHHHKSWDQDDFRTCVLNAIIWTAKLEVPKHGVKSLPNPTLRLKKSSSTSPKTKPLDVKDALFASKVITTKTKGHAVDIKAKVKGAKDLYLVMADGGDSHSCDWADWAEARLVDAAGKETKLTELKWKSASTGWGRIGINKNCGGQPLKINGRPVAYGIGAHANSVIHYQFPKDHKYVTFLARGGLDDGGSRQQGASVTSVQFLVFDKPPNLGSISQASAKERGLAPGIDHFPPDQLVLPEGLEIKLWAKSPLFYNPTNMDIDYKGRIWVAEGRNYRGRRTQADGDRIVVVEDKDGDGIAESSHVFVQEKMFNSPLGVAVVDNRILVSQPPDLIVYTDVNRNAVFDEGVDKREVLLTGFDGNNHDHSLHSVTVGPNGQYYFNHGNKGSKVTDKDGWQLNAGSFYSSRQVSGLPSGDGQVYVGGVALRVNQDGTGLRPIGHNFRNSYEQAVSSFGDVFQNDNDDPPASRTAWLMEYGNMGFASRNGLRNWRADIMPGQTTQVGEWRQEDPGSVPAGDVYGGGSPTGIAFYENGIMEDRFGGYVISCEPARNTLFGYHPKPEGAGITLPQRDVFLTSNPDKNFAGADFRNAGGQVGNITLFRPSDVTVGPDGAIYVSDWFDARVGGHSTRDRGQTGAIYRIAPKGDKLSVPKFDLSSTDGQIAALKNPSPNVRELGRAPLAAAGAKSIPAVNKLLDAPNGFIQARATWLLAKLGSEGLSIVESRLAHKNPQARISAFRALRHENHRVLEHAVKLAGDSSPLVRREVALALRYVPFDKCRDLLLRIADGYDGKDRYYVEAFGIGCTDKEEKVYAALREKHSAKEFDPKYAGLVWRLHPVSAVNELKGWAMDKDRDDATRRSMLFAISLIEAPQAATAMVEIAKSAGGETGKLASVFIDKRDQGIWNRYKAKDQLSGKPAGPTVYVDRLAPLQFAPESKLPKAAEILSLKGDAKAGKTMIGRCYVCHKIGSTGVEFGPTLAGWGRGQSREVILKAILDPSAELSHGFEGTELVVKGDKRIQGFIQAEGDPLVIRVFGGQDIVISKADLKSRKQVKTSFMAPASRLGLDAQQLRDVVEYLKLN
ncbi:MAG: NPCBM/NEW2 domain-containing protein [Verrucomicrobia bacterium]|nr:NPCBM/NEW2 domain-containing protein [Verrucomicrobiota bacterium]